MVPSYFIGLNGVCSLAISFWFDFNYAKLCWTIKEVTYRGSLVGYNEILWWWSHDDWWCVHWVEVVWFCARLCELWGVYGEGEFEKDKAFPYIIAVNNCSQFLAMYCLVLFYRANRDELQPMKPIGKFLCIKAVVFFSFLWVSFYMLFILFVRVVEIRLWGCHGVVDIVPGFKAGGTHGRSPLIIWLCVPSTLFCMTVKTDPEW